LHRISQLIAKIGWLKFVDTGHFIDGQLGLFG